MGEIADMILDGTLAEDGSYQGAIPMISKSDNEDDNELMLVYLGCECIDCVNEFEISECISSPYLKIQKDVTTRFCSEECRGIQEHYYRLNHSFNRQFTTEVEGITYTVTHTEGESEFRVEEIQIVNGSGDSAYIYEPRGCKLDTKTYAEIHNYILTHAADPKDLGMHSK